MISIVFPSWTPDAPCLIEAIGAVLDRGVPAEHCAVAHNPAVPLPEVTVNWAKDRGLTLLEHDYRMKPTIEAALTMASTLRDWGEATGASHVMKVDSDTVMARFGRVRQAVEDGVLAASWGWPGAHFAGCCCVLSREALGAISCPDNYRLLGGMVPGEDIAHHHILIRTFGFDRVRHWWYNKAGGFGKAWQFRHETLTLQDYAARYDMVTFGNRRMMEGGCRNDCYEKTALIMAKFRNILRDNEKQSIRS